MMWLFQRARYVFDAASFVNFDGGSAISNLNIDGDIQVRAVMASFNQGRLQGALQWLTLLTREPAPGMSVSDMSVEAYGRDGLEEPLDGLHSYLQASIAPVRAFHGRPRHALLQYDHHSPRPRAAHLVHAQRLRGPKVEADAVYFFLCGGGLALFRLNSYVFRHQLLPTYPVADIVNEKMD